MFQINKKELKIFLRIVLLFGLLFFAISGKDTSSFVPIEKEQQPVSLFQFNYDSNNDAIQNQQSFKLYSNSNFNGIKEHYRNIPFFFLSNSTTIGSDIASQIALIKIQFTAGITFYFTSLQIIFPFHTFW